MAVNNILEEHKGQYNERVAEAIDILRYKSEKSTTLERLRLCVEADELFGDLPQPLQLGNCIKYLLEHIQKPVEAHDLILGRILEEVPDEAGEAFFQKTVQWGRKEFGWGHIAGARCQSMMDYGHESFAWERLVELGLPGLENFAAGELEKRQKAGESEETLDFLRGAILIYQSFRSYARLYGEAAQKADLVVAAQSCFSIAERAPETFREALQLVWLVGHVFCTMCAINPTLSFGRMDEYLYPFYKKDMESGVLTEKEAEDLIEDFYCKNNLIMGRGEHQMSENGGIVTTWQRNLTYDAPQYVIIGGTRRDGGPCANALTNIFLKKIVPRFKNPVIVLRYTDDFPAELWTLACSKMGANASVMVYNDHVVIPSLIKSGIDAEDAVTYVMFGCNHLNIPGIHSTSPGDDSVGGGGVHILRYLLGELDKIYQEGECDTVTLDNIYERINMQVRSELVAFSERRKKTRARMPGLRPGNLRVDDCFLDGSIKNACSWALGSLKYEGTAFCIAFIASVIDSIVALDELVFKSKKVRLYDLLTALRNNFKDNEVLRQQCLNVPKFGQDEEVVDKHARRIMEMLYKTIGEFSYKDGENRVAITCTFETDNGNISEGAATGASPDGRLAGMPLSQNAGPAWGASTKGLTAMFQSLAKLPKELICAGAVNIKINPGLVRGEKNLKSFSNLLRTYFAIGGLQAQLSVTDAEELRDAQIETEKYRDLMVRITGYSATFVDMAKSAQDTIIQREEMTE